MSDQVDAVIYNSYNEDNYEDYSRDEDGHQGEKQEWGTGVI